jgi:ATP-dependent exoDNAse (exonuclease V) beta subunit
MTGAAGYADEPGVRPPADQRVRDRIRLDLDATLIIEAAAGTGKTTALVNRIVALVASGRAALDRIVAVTFTEKAAGELKLRLRGEIERARHDESFGSDARAMLARALEKLEEARIGTIHSFCADLLRERPVEAGVDPMFEVAPEDAAGTLFEAAFNRWFEDALANPGPAVRRVLRRRELADRDGPRPLLAIAASELRQWRDFETPWKREEFDRAAAIDELADAILALADIAGQHPDPEDWLRKGLEQIARPVREAIRLESVRPRDYDALEDTLLRLLHGRQNHWNWKGRGDQFGSLRRAEAFARRDAVRDLLEEFEQRAGANLAPMLRDELWPVIGYYTELKRRAGRLDFLDLLLCARDLVRGNAAVRAELQARFTHIFIDEFQDTDPLQAEILLLLAAGDPAESDWLNVTPTPGKLFIVGDPKQSIYRFRRADVALYQNIKRRLLARGAALEYLSVSFRATPEIQRMVNAAFAPLMADESETQPAYTALEPFRSDYPPQPAIVALPVPDPYSDFGRIIDFQIEHSDIDGPGRRPRAGQPERRYGLPDAVAAYIEWLVNESGWTVTERDAPATRAPIRPRHVCVLFRRLNSHGRDVTRPYARALEARHVPHVLVRGGSFSDREEIGAIRNALAAIEWPDDEMSVYATLRGPLMAIADGVLLEFRETFGGLHPFRKFPADPPPHLKEVADALALLRTLHRGRNRRPIADTIARLLSATRAHAGIAIWPTGDQALANLARLLDLSRRYESGGGAVSMRGFVGELEARAGRNEPGIAPMVEEGAEGVRIMSVHSAKGLEFPVVVMADMTCNETRNASRFVDPARGLCAQAIAGCAPRELLDNRAEEERRDQEEAVRLLYVAATRARDLMVLPVVGDERREGWLGRLNPVLYPAPRDAHSPLELRPAGCPGFRARIVGNRPPNVQARGVFPGAHRPELGAHRVTWWDAAALRLDAREAMGLRQTNLLQADERGERSGRGKREYDDWSAARAAAIAAGSEPSVRVAIATELAAMKPAPDLPEAAEVTLVEVARAAGRPHGVRFGTLVHAIMARVALDGDAEAVAETAAFFGRALGASPEEIAAAAAAAANALAAPIMRRAAAARELRRESALALALDDGGIVEGVADLAFAEEHNGATRWIVVDFKTDLEIAPRLAEYRVQLALYLRAIRRATGRGATASLLWI